MNLALTQEVGHCRESRRLAQLIGGDILHAEGINQAPGTIHVERAVEQGIAHRRLNLNFAICGAFLANPLGDGLRNRQVSRIVAGSDNETSGVRQANSGKRAVVAPVVDQKHDAMTGGDGVRVFSRSVFDRDHLAAAGSSFSRPYLPLFAEANDHGVVGKPTQAQSVDRVSQELSEQPDDTCDRRGGPGETSDLGLPVVIAVREPTLASENSKRAPRW